MKEKKMSTQDDAFHYASLEKPIIDATQCGFDATNPVSEDSQFLQFAIDLVDHSKEETPQALLDSIKQDIEEGKYDLDAQLGDIADTIISEGDL